MTSHASYLAALGLSATVLVGCRHREGESTPKVSAVLPSEAPPSVASNGDAALGDASTAIVDASLPPPDAAPAEAKGASSPPDMTSASRYPASALYEAFSQAEAKLVQCYLPGKKRNPNLRGKVIVKLTINPDGSAKPVVNEGSNLEDPEVVACVIRAVKTLRFTKPVEGSVTVVYPFIFRPTGDATLLLPDVGKP